MRLPKERGGVVFFPTGQRVRRLEALSAPLPQLNNFLRTTTHLQSALPGIAEHLHEANPELLTALVETDTNVLYRDPEIAGCVIRGFVRAKYGLASEGVAKMRRLPSLGRYLQDKTRGLRSNLWYLTHITARETTEKEPLSSPYFRKSEDVAIDVGDADRLTQPFRMPQTADAASKTPRQ